jgi:hypothetical protein
LGVSSAQAVIEHEHEHEQEQEERAEFRRKKLPPPTPDRREGRLFPPEQSWKTLRLLNELPADRNKFYLKKFNTQNAAKLIDKVNDEIQMTKKHLRVFVS